MFNKKKDTLLKITNCILLIIIVGSLGVALGNNIYKENLYTSCNDMNSFGISSETKEDYEANCKYAKLVSSMDAEKNMYLGYSLFATATAILIISNLAKKKEE